VFLLGLAAHARLVQINAEELQLVLAMNRLRHAYLEIEPGLEPYLRTGHHDDEQGVLATYLLDRPTRQSLGAGFFLLDTPTIVATVDAALAAGMVVLVLQVAEAPPRGGGRWGGGVPGGLGGAVSPAAAQPAPVPQRHPEVPHPTGPALTDPGCRVEGCAG